jgi:CubicO group peptidase (beta-lactamase class C family)
LSQRSVICVPDIAKLIAL